MVTILYPTRGGNVTHRNQDWVFALAKERQARLILLYVSNVHFLDYMPTPVSIDRVWEEMDELGDFLLTMAQDRADRVGVSAEKMIRHGRFRDAIKAVIQEKAVSTVILGRPTEDTAITTPELIQEVAEYLSAETNVEVYVIDEGQVLNHLPADNK